MSGKTVSEVDIWSGVVSPDGGEMSVPEAEAILRWTFRDADKRQMEQLSDRNADGALSESDRELLEAYVNVGQVIAILQAKARLALKRTAAEDVG